MSHPQIGHDYAEETIEKVINEEEGNIGDMQMEQEEKETDDLSDRYESEREQQANG